MQQSTTPRRVLVFGNLGYVGAVLTEALRHLPLPPTVIGHDAEFFEGAFDRSAARAPVARADVQIAGDVRAVDPGVFSGADAVIYLAAVSNDPMGRAFARPTHQINAEAALDVAARAKAAGVRAFVFASSCSVYGAAGDAPRTEDDPTDPLTDYARSKLDAEAGLRPLADAGFTVTCLRFATACGPSPRMRLDLVLNDFVAAARGAGRIEILSDGTPLRPLIDVRDMAGAMIWAAGRGAEPGGAFLTVNAGSDDWNFSVLDLARAVAAAFGGVEVQVNPDAAPDRRSYRVDFARFRRLAPDAYPRRDIAETIAGIDVALAGADLAGFRDGPLIRLNWLSRLRDAGRLDASLRWL